MLHRAEVTQLDPEVFVRTSTALMAGAVLLAMAACKETTKIESKQTAPAAAPADKGPGIEVRTKNDTVKVDSTGIRATIHKDS